MVALGNWKDETNLRTKANRLAFERAELGARAAAAGELLKEIADQAPSSVFALMRGTDRSSKSRGGGALS